MKSVNFENILQKDSKYELEITKGEKPIVLLDKIRSGGSPSNGIPSIDEPKFVQICILQICYIFKPKQGNDALPPVNSPKIQY